MWLLVTMGPWSATTTIAIFVITYTSWGIDSAHVLSYTWSWVGGFCLVDQFSLTWGATPVLDTGKLDLKTISSLSSMICGTHFQLHPRLISGTLLSTSSLIFSICLNGLAALGGERSCRREIFHHSIHSVRGITYTLLHIVHCLSPPSASRRMLAFSRSLESCAGASPPRYVARSGK
jgi:hypothetical protein